LHPLLAARRAEEADAVTVLTVVDTGQRKPAIRLPSGYWLFDSRADVGVLFLTHPPIEPELRFLSSGALDAAFNPVKVREASR
jgi:hypothetical protein